MLALTPTAVAVVNKLITAAPGRPESAGLRISSETAPEGRLQVEITPSPAENDQVVAETGARVFLAPETASYLDDKVLDSAVDDHGGAQFMLSAQSRNGDSPHD